MEATKNRKTSGPDTSELGRRDLPRATFPGRGGDSFRIFMTPEVHAQILAHGAQDTTVEICGVLVGRWQQDDDGPFVAVTAAIPGEKAASKLVEVTFTHETWANINKRMDQEFVNDRIVGWYHTHPNFGIFLSDRDRFIHEHFFSDPGQIACVVDPVRKEEGIFVWDDGKPKPCSHYWIGRKMHFGTGDPQRRSREEPSGRSASAASRTESPQAAEDVAPPVYAEHWTTKAMWGLMAFLIGFLAASTYASWQRDSFVQTVVTRFAITKGLKPGLSSQLTYIETAVGVLADQANNLQPSASAANLSPAELSTRLGHVQQALGGLREVYGLSPEDELTARKLRLTDLVQLGQSGPAATQPALTAMPAPSATQPAPAPAPQEPARP